MYPYSATLPALKIDRLGDPVSYKRVIELIAVDYGLRPADLLRRSRMRRFVEPRMLAIYLMRHDLGMGVVESGLIFRLDHSTISHACKTVENLIQTQPKFKQRLERVRSKI